MFHIFVEDHFSAGHHLRNYPGNCERPHGHNWKVKVTVESSGLDELGMGIDFRAVKKALGQAMADLDHCNLNEHIEFINKNPSSENIAAYIFGRLKKKLNTNRCRLLSVSVRETENTGVTYFE